MDKFNALPFPQRIGALAAALLVFGGLFYYTLVIPGVEAVTQAEAAVANVNTDLSELKKKLEKLQVKDADITKLRKEETELADKVKRFEEMLPKAKEMEKFITGISETARNSGLELLSFKKGKLSHRDFYFEVPIDMEVRGTFRELLGFLRTISESGRRAINIRELAVSRETLPVQRIVRKYEQRRKDELPDGGAARPLDPAAKLMQLVRANEEAINEGVQLSAKFTAHVFSYTGKVADSRWAQKNKANQNKRDQKRKEILAQ